MTRQDKTRQDKTRQDKTRQDKTRQDKTCKNTLILNVSGTRDTYLYFGSFLRFSSTAGFLTTTDINLSISAAFSGGET